MIGPQSRSISPFTCTIAEPKEAHAGSFCDKTRGWADAEGKTPVRKCAPLETSVLRAFRKAETPYWCAHDTFEDLDAARVTCQNALGGKDKSETSVSSALFSNAVPECEACAEMLAPHIRASCNSKAYAIANDPQRRSTCDDETIAVKLARGTTTGKLAVLTRSGLGRSDVELVVTP